MLRISQLEKAYGTKQGKALGRLSLLIKENSFTAIIGHSGSGKSTLLHLIAGLTQADHGEIWWRGKRVGGPLAKLVPGEDGIALVSQADLLLPMHTVYEQMEFKIRHLQEAEKSRRIKQIIGLLGLAGLKGKRVNELSGGERQRVNLGVQLCAYTPLLLLDEPFTYLDSAYRQKVLNWLNELKMQKKTTLLMATHLPSEAFSLCERALILNKGKKVFFGDLKEAYFNPKNLYQAQVLGEAEELELTGKTSLVRPEWWQLSKDGLQVTVEQIQFSPHGFNCLVINRQGDQFHVLLAEEPRLNEEIRVSLRIPPHHS